MWHAGMVRGVGTEKLGGRGNGVKLVKGNGEDCRKLKVPKKMKKAHSPSPFSFIHLRLLLVWCLLFIMENSTLGGLADQFGLHAIIDYTLLCTFQETCYYKKHL